MFCCDCVDNFVLMTCIAVWTGRCVDRSIDVLMCWSVDGCADTLKCWTVDMLMLTTVLNSVDVLKCWSAKLFEVLRLYYCVDDLCWWHCVDVLTCRWPVLICWCWLCWTVDVLIRWSVEPLVCWCVGGVLKCWSVEGSNYWSVDVLCWLIDLMKCWCIEVLLCDVLRWFTDALTCYCVEVFVCWFIGTVRGNRPSTRVKTTIRHALGVNGWDSRVTNFVIRQNRNFFRHGCTLALLLESSHPRQLLHIEFHRLVTALGLAGLQILHTTAELGC
jgi:hypothetical protein